MVTALDISGLKRLIGPETPVPEELFTNTEATRDNFRHFALAVGDLNPLWHDEDYARRSPLGELVARPGWLGTVCDVAHPTHGEMRQRHNGQHAGIGWQFFAPVRLGERFRVTSHVTDVVEKTSSLGPSALITGKVNYYSERGELLARSSSTTLFYNSSNVALESVAQRQPVIPTPPEEMLPAAVALTLVQRRGAEPRYWEDTQIGDELTPLPRGTLTVAEMTRWFVGEHRITRASVEALPSQGRDHADRHSDVENARADGVPALFDIGRQRAAWLTQVVLDWMGDHGTLKEVNCQFRRFVYLGDTTTCGGVVTKMYVANGDHIVELDIWVKNQRDEVVSPGTAVVALPSRS